MCKPWSGVRRLGKHKEWRLHEEVSSVKVFMTETERKAAIRNNEKEQEVRE